MNSSGGSATVLDAGSTNGLNNYLMTLSAGVYELRLTNVGSQQAEVQWLLKIASLDWEKIIDNGVSQSSALSLMTFAPTPAGPGTGTGLLSIPPSAVGDAFGGSLGPMPSSLLVTLNTALTGQPSWDGQAISGAGLVADAAAIAAAGGATGQALAAGHHLDGLAQEADRTTTTRARSSSRDRIRSAAGEPIGSTRKPSRHAATPTPRAHEPTFALAQAEWVVRIGSSIQDWFASSRSDVRVQPPWTSRAPQLSLAGIQPRLFVTGPANSWRNRRFHLDVAERNRRGRGH